MKSWDLFIFGSATNSGSTRNVYRLSFIDRHILKNLLVITIVFLLLFLAYNGLASLQSTLHREHGLGTLTQSITYISYFISSLLLPRSVSHQYTISLGWLFFNLISRTQCCRQRHIELVGWVGDSIYSCFLLRFPPQLVIFTGLVVPP